MRVREAGRIGIAVFGACGRSGQGTETPRAAAPAPVPTVTATAVASVQPSAAHSIAPVASAVVPPQRIGPDAEAWKSATQATSKGGALLGCRTERAGDWARVACRNDGLFGSVPTQIGVDAARQKAGAIGARVEADRAELTFEWKSGSDVTATFAWNDGVVVFRATWPEGKPAPKEVGTFRGADMDPKRVESFVCGCAAKLMPGVACKLGAGTEGMALECVRTHMPSANCGALMECRSMEPSSFAKCLDGEIYTGVCPSCRCASPCAETKDCPPGMSCIESFRGDKICDMPSL
jgi:hypothetical protein